MNAKKITYALRGAWSGCYYQITEGTIKGIGSSDVKTATQFSSIPELLKRVSGARLGLLDLKIVKIVEETPKPSIEVVTLDNDLIDPKHAVVLYNVRKQMYVRYDSTGALGYGLLEDAHVWGSLAAALKFQFPRTSVGLPEEIEVRNVKEKERLPIITETVLQ